MADGAVDFRRRPRIPHVPKRSRLRASDIFGRRARCSAGAYVAVLMLAAAFAKTLLIAWAKLFIPTTALKAITTNNSAYSVRSCPLSSRHKRLGSLHMGQ